MEAGDYHDADASASVRQTANVRRANELRSDRMYPLADKKLSVPRAALVGKAGRDWHFKLGTPPAVVVLDDDGTEAHPCGRRRRRPP
jgi:hypothetical protein